MGRQITIEQTRAAFDLGEQVYTGQLTRGEATATLEDEYGMNPGSAGDLVQQYKCMRDGQRYTRTINAAGLDYYLQQILERHGLEAAENAIDATRQHISYYQKVGNTSYDKFQGVLNAFVAGLEQHQPSRYWLTTHWPPPLGPDRGVPPWRHIWLREQKQSAGKNLRPGDKVFIYESAKGRAYESPRPDGGTDQYKPGKGRQGIVSVGEVARRLQPDGWQQPHDYGGGETKWWRWKAPTEHHNDKGFVSREHVHAIIGGHPNLLGLGGGSGLLELTEGKYQQLLTAFLDNAPTPPEPEQPHGHGGGGESDAHKRLKHYVAEHPEQVFNEPGIKLVQVEYPFTTGDRIDVLLQDREGRPLAVEIELAQAAHQTEGFLQAIKYRSLICAWWDRPIDGGRCALIAHELAPEIIERCRKHDVLPLLIPRETVAG
jgi:hypothetical protein